MTVTGYRAPHSTVLHRPVLSATARTWCGMPLPADDTWDEQAHGEAYTCQRCATAYNTRDDTRIPWQDGERHVYTQRRHPGLLHFLINYQGKARTGASWRLVGAPRTTFTATRSRQARTDHLYCLSTNFLPVGYFASTTEAVDFTKQIQATGHLVRFLRQVDTATWDPHTDPAAYLSQLDRSIHEETNPT